MLKTLALTALLALTACAAPLTGDALQDCLNAKNAVIEAQNVVLATEAAAVLHPGPDADHAVVFAKTYLATAQARESVLCTVPII